jgi:hypothetical protein
VHTGQNGGSENQRCQWPQLSQEYGVRGMLGSGSGRVVEGGVEGGGEESCRRRSRARGCGQGARPATAAENAASCAVNGLVAVSNGTPTGSPPAAS